MKDILKEQLKNIQLEYKKLLVDIKPYIDDNIASVVDEINMIWLQHKKLILFALEKYFIPFKTFLFTAATFLDYDNKEHFPFSLCDGVCIVDDVICLYGNSSLEYGGFSQTLKEQLLIAVDDNIKILENCADYIFILPIRFLSEEDSETVKIGTENLFLDLFDKRFECLKDYFSNVKTIEDIEKYIKKEALESLMLCKDDDHRLSLSDRMKLYIQDINDDEFFSERTLGELFFFSVYGHFAQILNVLLLCTRYNLIPYLRYRVAFYNFCLLIGNLPEDQFRAQLENNTYCCYMIYKAFDKSLVNFPDYKKLTEKARTLNLYNQTYIKITQATELSVSQKIDFIKKLLKDYYY